MVMGYDFKKYKTNSFFSHEVLTAEGDNNNILLFFCGGLILFCFYFLCFISWVDGRGCPALYCIFAW